MMGFRISPCYSFLYGFGNRHPLRVWGLPVSSCLGLRLFHLFGLGLCQATLCGLRSRRSRARGHGKRKLILYPESQVRAVKLEGYGNTQEATSVRKAVTTLSVRDGTPARLLAQLRTFQFLCQDDGAASEFQHRHILGGCALHSRLLRGCCPAVPEILAVIPKSGNHCY